MTVLLRTLLSLALSGSVLILLLLLLLPRLRARTSRRWQYYIWLAAVLRLLVPFAPEASLMNQLFAPPAAVSQVGSLPEEDSAAPVLPDGAEQAADSEAALPGTDPLPEGNAGEGPSAGSSPAENPDGDAPAGTTDYPGAGAPGGLTLPDAGRLAQAAAPAVLALWLGTALVLLIRRGLTYRSFVRAVRREARPADDPALLGCLRRASRRAGVRHEVELLCLPGLPTPMLLGVQHPCIVLPDRETGREELFCTLLHELIHYRRRDFLCRWLAGAAACLHWWNPLARRLEREMDHACELACDEAVLRLLRPGDRRLYGEVLLRAAAGSVSPALPLSQGGKLLRDRLQAILSYQERRSPWPAVLVTGVVAALAVGLGACSLPLPELGSAPEKPDASQSEPDSSQTEPEAAPSQAEIPPERAALMAQLPPMVPDSNGTYPTIPGDLYDELVIQSDQPVGEKPSLDQLDSFEENPLCTRMMAQQYYELESWSVLYESRDWVLAPNEFDPEQMVFRDRWVPSYFVILEISGDGENDRMILSCQVSYTVASSSGDYVPRVSLTRTAYTGREADLRLGEDLSGWQAVLAEGSTSHYNFWNPTTGQGILISDFGCLPLSGLTEPPPFAFAVYARTEGGVSGSTGEDQLITPRFASGENWVMLWDSETHTLTELSGLGTSPQLFWLENNVLAIVCEERVCLYAENSAEPLAVIEAGAGLSEDAEAIFYNLAPLREGGGQYAIAYCTPEEWRFCVFDSTGEVLSEFGSGLYPGSPDDRYLADFSYTQGLLYFVYYPDGTGVSETAMRCYIDARPDHDHTVQVVE